MRKERTKAIVRLLIAFVFLAVVALIAFGAIDADKLTLGVATALGVASQVYAWWKDNNITQKAMDIHGITDEDEETEAEG